MSRLTFKTATFIACSLVLFCQSLVAQDATTRSKARAVFEANNGKIYVVKALVALRFQPMEPRQETAR